MARRGENIHKRKDGRWEGRYISARRPDGKAKYSSVYGKSYSVVKKEMVLKKQSVFNEDRQNDMLFSEILNLWLESNTPKLKDSTIIKYSSLIEKHIAPVLGKFYVSELNTITINSFIKDKLDNGRLDGNGGISASYARTIILIIKSALSYAANEGICYPIKNELYSPKLKKSSVFALTKSEQMKLEKCLFNNINSTTIGILIALYTGMRLGEICALKWADVDFQKKIICVNNTVSRVKTDDETGFTLSKPKTDNSIRIIPIISILLRNLKIAKDKSKSIYVVSDKETFISLRTFEYRFHKEIEKCNLTSFNFHKLRHTFATNCISSGVDIKTLSEILGHASVSTTLNLYVHPPLEQKKKQMKKIDKNIA